ncbi:Arc family DNA-binding protein [Pseudomonas sp. LPB0260]|uniref:Arc family DNA-binding protein n=1 Tax=Pseudomonas sp. LPB0260 TaxID=2614442 RepID=UPI0015C1F1D9|nr:Arc family DNA-binding protein [Pseudomonas sp. LPB0260]QLC73695.1 Arc family DNA-binding protein [Pseudomonas sp. LPB0260]QLC76469.1 Arc family DNA-binding protein [Pseudomonas sp. LPB0260]
MSRTDPQFKLRVPPKLRSKIEQSAFAARRSMNSEVVIRLEASYAQEKTAKEGNQ